MALKACKECGREVSTSAITCPSCGVKSPTRKGPSKIVIFGGGFLLLIFLIGRCSGGGSRGGATSSDVSQLVPATQAAATPVTAAKLWTDYDANEVSADNRYKNRSLAVSGIVDSIDKNAFNDVYVSLRSPNEFMPVHATLKSSQVSIAGNLTKGQQVVVNCTGGGRLVGTPILNDCVFQ